MTTPEQILKCLDDLELYSDDPVRVLRIKGELQQRLHEFVLEVRDFTTMQQEKIDDLVLQLEAICREPV